MKTKYLAFLSYLLLSSITMSCGDDNSESINSSGNQYTIDTNIEYLSSQLFNSNWTYQYSDFYNKDNGHYSHTNTDFAKEFTFSFSNKIFSNNKYQLLVNGKSDAACWWYIDENGLNYSATDYGYRFANMNATDVGRWSSCGGCIFDGYIFTHTDSKLILKDYYSDGKNYVQHVFYNVSSNSGGESGESEKPDVGFYDFTATKTSLKIQYKIYNKDEAKVSSAKIYYGTSRNPTSVKNATVSGTLITANITGLKAGTTYYVKCVASGKGGTTTTEVTKCITNY